MVTSLDLLYVAFFAAAWPLFEHFVGWPAFQRRKHLAPVEARHWLWTTSIVAPWGLVAIGAALWMFFGRPWSALGFTWPQGWRLALVIALIVAFVAYQADCIVQLQRSPALARTPARRSAISPT